MVRARISGRPSARHEMKIRLRRSGLNTVCEEARCPNLTECFAARTATFLILGDRCTRACRFCGIAKDTAPTAPEPDEPRRVAEAVRDLELRLAVVTSVTRDDLADGGAGAFAATIRAIRRVSPGTRVEVLVPDFGGRLEASEPIWAERPEVFNHNVETVGRLYPRVRPGAELKRSLALLQAATQRGGMLVKTGLMLGLGETDEEVEELLTQVQRAGVRLVTIGQYYRPRPGCLPVSREVGPESFEHFRSLGDSLGLRVVAGALVRSSYHARQVWESMTAPDC